MLSFIKCRSDKLQWKCRQWTWDACHELYQTVSWWPLSKSYTHPTKRSGHTRKEVLSYWRSLQHWVQSLSVSWGWPLITHTKDGKLSAPLELCPAQPAAEHMKASFFKTNTLEEGKGWQGPSGTLISRGIGPMSSPAGLHCWDYMCQRLPEKGRPHNNTGSIKCPPFSSYGKLISEVSG